MPDIDDATGRLQARHPGVEIPLIECGDGWFDVLDRMLTAIEDAGLTTRIEDIKQKFGELRVYHDTVFDVSEQDRVDAVAAIVAKAEQEAKATCEWCGRPGRMRVHGGWYTTLCDEHDLEWQRARQGGQ